jgi:tetratricopeptide (TPR) repeat protein
MKSTLFAGSLTLLVVSACAYVLAQAQVPPKAADPAAAAKESLSLAEHGKCKEALQLLRKAPRTADKDLKLKAGVATVRCAINLDQTEAAVEAIALLNREFPRDPEVLYVTTHAYSDLSTRASLELARTAPDSYQAHEMNAEALELQGKWDDAAKEYQAILIQYPGVPGIHFRLARLYLSKPDTEGNAGEKAKKELESELQIDPKNSAAEYLLGELAREATEWDEAIGHFSRSANLDPSFADAFLGLGMSYVSAGKFTEAINPLETYVKMHPGNPAGHYQLAVAYSRTGRMDDAKREAALQKATAAKIEQEKERNTDAAQKSAAGQEAQKPELRR